MAENNQASKPAPNLKPKVKSATNADIKKSSQPRRLKPPIAESKILQQPKPAPAPVSSSTPALGHAPTLADVSNGIKIISASREDSSLPVSTPAASGLKQKPAKPQVEGINAPYLNPPLAEVPRLTRAEIKIIEETGAPGRIFSPQATKSGSVQNLKLQGPKKRIWPYIIIILIVSGFLSWQHAGIGGILKNYLPSNKQTAGDAGKTFNTTNANPVPAADNPAATTTAESNILPVVPPITATPVTKLKVASTPTGYLNVRAQPSLAGTIITQVYPGETYAYSQVQNGWYYITLADGSLGWVSGKYIVKVK